LLRNVIQMSHDLGMSVVAEGVETQSQLDVLKRLKCDEIQGYYYSPPVSADQFRVLLENQPLIGSEYCHG
jgi:EAL domain-containing protein (putative c-di-GMP-specific phosphodiesterase class I)